MDKTALHSEVLVLRSEVNLLGRWHDLPGKLMIRKRSFLLNISSISFATDSFLNYNTKLYKLLDVEFNVGYICVTPSNFYSCCNFSLLMCFLLVYVRNHKLYFPVGMNKAFICLYIPCNLPRIILFMWLLMDWCCSLVGSRLTLTFFPEEDWQKELFFNSTNYEH